VIYGFAGARLGMPLEELIGIFPNLTATRQTISSPINPTYNCVAWAANDTERWWEPYGLILPEPFPPYYWPNHLPNNLLPQTIVLLFEELGFEVTLNIEGYLVESNDKNGAF